MPHVTPTADDARWAFFAAEPPAAAPVCSGRAVPISSISTNNPPVDLSRLTDRNPHTMWATSHVQHQGDELTLDLAIPLHPCAVEISVGEFRKSYPRKLAVETSLTGDEWTTVAVERTAGLTMRGALRNPKMVTIVIPLAASVGRFVRLRVDETHPSVAWVVTDIEVIASD
jgi:hypothetical protein